MQRYFSLNHIFILLLAIANLCLAACSIHNNPRHETNAVLPPLTKIAVLPIDRANLKPQRDDLSCALTDTFYEAGDVSLEAARTVTQLLLKHLGNDPKFIPVEEKKCINFLNAMLISQPNATQLKLIQALGKELGADAVLYGKLYRFEERIGGPYGVERPASVAFTLYLIRTNDGAVLWRYSFNETQQSLTENLFKAKLYKKSGMRWLTAKELANIGIEEAIADLKKRFPK